MFVHHWRGDEAVDAFFAKQLDCAFLGGVASLAADDEQHVALCLGECAHSGRDFVVVRVIVFLDDQSDAAITCRGPHPRLLCRSVIEGLDSGDNAVPGVDPNIGAVIENGRDGGLGDTGLACDV